MAADPSAPATTITCGACSAQNLVDAQFCNGCGHALREPCADCSRPVLLTQSFCGNCGHDLTKAIAKTRNKFQQWMVDAIAKAKEDEFEEALGLLSRMTRTEDYRFRDMVDNAKQATEKISKIAHQRRQIAKAAMEQVGPALENEDHQRIVAILETAPPKLISPEALQAYERSKAFLESQGSLATEIQKAISERDWQTAGPLLAQLNSLEPENQDCIALAGKVGQKLFSRAKKIFEARKYQKVLDQLDLIPPVAQLPEYAALRRRVENVVWLRQQFEDEPFDTPMLGRLAVRLQKDEPSEPRNEKRVQRISANLRQQDQRPDRTQYPSRLGIPQSWLGGELGYLSSIKSVERQDFAELRSRWGQMNLAFGLALQGIGEGRIKTQLAPKDGLLKRLTRKKTNVAWGIDIGSFSIKVVGLQKTEEEITMIDGFVHPFEHPLCRPGYDEDPLNATAAAISQIMEQHSFGDAPVWINMPANNLVTRFTLLPPVPDKQATQLLDKEVNERIPLEVDTLWIDHWIAPYDPDSAIGRPAVISALKKKTIEQRLERLALTDLNIQGMQVDTLALINFASFEFEKELEEEFEDETKTPTIALVDCGAETTSAILLSKNAHWSWTVEFGGEELTGLLAREIKQNRSESELVKQNPHQMPDPASNYGSIENRLDSWNSRLRKMFEDALEANPAFEITNVYGVGGCCLAHQWFRRVLCGSH